jgi:hypothetical protein
MSSVLTIRCPGCKKEHTVSPGGDYGRCKRCATPHCIFCGGGMGPCKVAGCNGWQEKQKNPS